jgi:hypothetical protein
VATEIAGVVKRVRALAMQRRVHFTLKAANEMGSLGLDATDGCEALVGLGVADFQQALVSDLTAEVMYVFKPRIGGFRFYVKLILRSRCVVVSFHEDEGDHDEAV